MASVSQLKSELRALENKLKIMKERLKKLEKIDSGLEKKLDSQIVDVNKNIKSCSEKMESGVWGFARASVIPDEIEQKREYSSSADASVSEMLRYLAMEISRCKTEKTNLESAISRKKQEIKEAERREREAKKNQS